MSTPQHSAAETTISPKVTAQALTSAALVVILAVITAVTPDMVAGLGAWAPLVYAAVVALGGVIAGYLKRDPLRS
jgi:membrane protein YdbS with pleckstrin-like domain